MPARTKRAEALLRDVIFGRDQTPSAIVNGIERHLRLAEAKALEGLARWIEHEEHDWRFVIAEARRRAAKLRGTT